MNPALMQRLVTFHTYFFGFLILDRQSFFGEPPSTTETFVMALVLALAVTLLSPLVASLMDRRGSGRGRRNGNSVASNPMITDLGL